MGLEECALRAFLWCVCDSPRHMNSHTILTTSAKKSSSDICCGTCLVSCWTPLLGSAGRGLREASKRLGGVGGAGSSALWDCCWCERQMNSHANLMISAAKSSSDMRELCGASGLEEAATGSAASALRTSRWCLFDSHDTNLFTNFRISTAVLTSAGLRVKGSGEWTELSKCGGASWKAFGAESPAAEPPYKNKTRTDNSCSKRPMTETGLGKKQDWRARSCLNIWGGCLAAGYPVVVVNPVIGIRLEPYLN